MDSIIQADPGFPDVPARLFEVACWHEVFVRRWRYREAIHVQGARSGVALTRRAARGVDGFERLRVGLGDIALAALSFSKGRAACFALLVQ
eukprot:11178897-Lingulodinium_polyedra.AAC.1